MPNDRRDLSILCSALEGTVPPLADWAPILALANRTLVTPALASALRDKVEVPGDVQAFLAHIAERTEQRNALMRDQLIEAVHALSRRGITPIIIKGAAFLASQPSDCVPRLSTDLDLVVPLDAAATTREALKSIGYRPQSQGFARGAGLSFERDSDAGELDVHYRLRSFECWPTFEQLEPFCASADLSGAKVLLPSPSLQAATLIAHDQLQERDYWRGLIDLRHLVDLRAIVAQAGSLDAATLTVFFSSNRAQRALSTQLETFHRLFPKAAPLQDESGIWARLQSSRRLMQIGHDRTGRMLTAMSLLLDPPAVAKPLRPLETYRERMQYLKRFFAVRKPNKV